MDPFFHLVERKLDEAERAGAFCDLPGAGKPLVLDDLDGVPAELRAGYLMLKANGFVPPELEARKEWLRLQDLLAACHDPDARAGLADATRQAHLRWRLLAEERGVDRVRRRDGGADRRVVHGELKAPRPRPMASGEPREARRAQPDDGGMRTRARPRRGGP